MCPSTVAHQDSMLNVHNILFTSESPWDHLHSANAGLSLATGIDHACCLTHKTRDASNTLQCVACCQLTCVYASLLLTSTDQ